MTCSVQPRTTLQVSATCRPAPLRPPPAAAPRGANCLSWLFYGFLIRDWFVYIPNQAGLVFGWYYMFSCFKFSKDAAQDVMTGIILATVMLYWVVGILHQALNLGPEGAKTLWCALAPRKSLHARACCWGDW